MDLERQREELEALKAMYPEDEGCFVLAPAEEQAWAAATAAVAAADGGTAAQQQHPNLSGTIRLPDVMLDQQPVALRFQLPPGYPSAEPPLLSVECSANRLIHEQLSCAVRAAAECAVGSESIMLVLDALQDAATAAAATSTSAQADPTPAINSTTATSTTQLQAAPAGQQQHVTQDQHAQPAAIQDTRSSSSSCPHDLLQAVVWFHHIKNTEKRKNLIAWARELHCGGFSKPGFPGVVVVEGLVGDVREYLARVRALQWQAMQVRAERLVECTACKASTSSSAQEGGAKAQQQPCRAFLPQQFAELPESGMSELGQACKAAGLEDLFLAALKLRK